MDDTHLREVLVAELQRSGVAEEPAIARAFAVVPRHRFVPEVLVDEAYADRAISIKSAGGETLASISQPSMLARMLELAHVTHGERILEVGTGSGYNAALLAELAGTDGFVATIDVEADLVERAHATLASCGYDRVRVVLGDGHAGFAPEAPYDRIIVSARATDITQAWWDQLREGGRIVVPLDIGVAGEYAVGFERNNGEMRSVGIVSCLFVPLRGEPERAPENIFARLPSVRYGGRPRPIREILAVPTTDASPEMLEHADIVVAQPITTFAVTWA